MYGPGLRGLPVVGSIYWLACSGIRSSDFCYYCLDYLVCVCVSTYIILCTLHKYCRATLKDGGGWGGGGVGQLVTQRGVGLKTPFSQ